MSYSIATSSTVAVVPKRANAVLAQLSHHLTAGSASVSGSTGAASKEGEKKATLTVIDNRTGKQIELPIQHNTIVATKFLDFGLK